MNAIIKAAVYLPHITLTKKGHRNPWLIACEENLIFKG